MLEFLLKIGEEDWFSLLFFCDKSESSRRRVRCRSLTTSVSKAQQQFINVRILQVSSFGSCSGLQGFRLIVDTRFEELRIVSQDHRFIRIPEGSVKLEQKKCNYCGA